jgi:hypothetical protein
MARPIFQPAAIGKGEEEKENVQGKSTLQHRHRMTFIDARQNCMLSKTPGRQNFRYTISIPSLLKTNGVENYE